MNPTETRKDRRPAPNPGALWRRVRKLGVWLVCIGVWGWAQAAGRVDANTASVDGLQTVAGIGPARAQRMIAERQRGPFKSLDDLQARVPGIGPKSVKKLAAAGLTVVPPPAAKAPDGPRGVIYHVNR